MKPKSSHTRRFLAASMTVTLASFALSPTVEADNLYWDGPTVIANGASAGGSGSWNNGAVGWEDGSSAQNWTDGNDAILAGTAGTTTLGGAISANSVSFNTTGYNLTLVGNTLTTGALNYGGAANGTLTITGNAGTTNGQNVVTLNGSGAGWSAGTSVLLTGASNPGAGSATNNGPLAKLVFGNASALGSAEIKVKHGMIQTGSAAMTITNAITNNAGGMYFGGEHDFTVSGLVKLDTGNSRTIGVWEGAAEARTITLTNMDTNGGNFNFEARGATPATPNTGGGFIVNGVISGIGGISTVSGAAFIGNTVTLNGANTYTGATAMFSGTYKAGVASVAGVSGAFGKNSAMTIVGGAVDLNGYNTAIGSLSGSGGTMTLSSAAILTTGGNNTSTGFSGVISGTGALIKTGTGTQTLSNIANSFAGNITVDGGTLTANGSTGGTNTVLGLASNSRTITVNTGGKLSMTTSNVLGNNAQTLSNTTNLTINSGGTATASAYNVVGNVALNGGLLTATGGSGNSYQSYEFNGSTVSVGGATVSTITASGNNSGMHIAGGKTLTLDVGDSVVGVGTDLTVSAAFINGSNDRSGNGALLKTGAGTAALSATNTYTGGTTISNGILDLTGGGGASGTIRGTATVNSGATLRLSTADATGYNTDATRLGVITLNEGTLHVNTVSNQTLGSAVVNMTGGSITGIADSNIDFFGGSSKLNTLASATTSTISLPTMNLRQDTTVFAIADGAAVNDLVIRSAIGNGSGEFTNILTKDGAGTMEISSNSNTYTGATNINQGTLVISGNISTSILTTVASGATITGIGTTGALTVLSGGEINPGNSPGTLNSGSLDLGGTYNAEIAGTTVGSGYDQINVSGTVTLSGMLNLITSFTPTTGDMFFLIQNDEIDEVNGIFTGLADGSSFFAGLQEYKISYFGDAENATPSFTGGNDVVLMAIPEPSATLLGGLGMLALLRRRRVSA